jgi:hypothetical protein
MIPSRSDHHHTPTPDLRPRRIAHAQALEVPQLLDVAVVAAILATAAGYIPRLVSERRFPY